MSPGEPAGLLVLEAGVLTTVQDRGRTGYAHLGVPRAGALDRPAAELANRLVGNPPAAAVLETTLGGVRLRNAGPGRWAAVTGARAGVTVDGTAAPFGQAVWWPTHAELALGRPADGVRSYLAVAGGIDVAPVLGSRSTDTLSWVGPPRVTAGARLPLGAPGGAPAAADVPPRRVAAGLRLLPGPRADWFAPGALDLLTSSAWVVRPESDRIGLRLDGPALARVRGGELPSEGMVLGAVQVPPDGRPIVFLADHPPTGGYPVVAVVHPDDLWQCAQVRPGEQVRFRRAARA